MRFRKYVILLLLIIWNVIWSIMENVEKDKFLEILQPVLKIVFWKLLLV